MSIMNVQSIKILQPNGNTEIAINTKSNAVQYVDLDHPSKLLRSILAPYILKLFYGNDEMCTYACL